MLSGVAIEGARSSSEAAWRPPSVSSSDMSAQMKAAVRRPQPGTEAMMSSRRERTASVAMPACRRSMVTEGPPGGLRTEFGAQLAEGAERGLSALPPPRCSYTVFL